jgi:Protein of unknown function (DUF3800)
MNIYIDESGTFVPAQHLGSWCVVAALVAPEVARRQIEEAVAKLLNGGNSPSSQEVKLNSLTDEQYAGFLEALYDAGVVMFAVATDSGANLPPLTERHKSEQVASLRANIPKMKFETGKAAIAHLADQIEALPNQLYIQLVCQVRLAHSVISRSISYFAQRHPATLRELRWRIDQKNSSKPVFEETFERVAPPLLQSHSFDDPVLMVRGFDYSHMKDFEFSDGEYPDYLQRDHGLPEVPGFNVQKLLRKNLKFEDSKQSTGIQAADLLASGLRRLLRGKYQPDSRIGEGLARLTLQNQLQSLPIELITLSDSTIADPIASQTLRQMIIDRSVTHDNR